MRFVLHDAVLNGEDPVLVLIDQLVDRVAEEIHRLEVHDVEAIEASKWYQSARPTRKKLLKTAVAGPPRHSTGPGGPHRRVMSIRDANDAGEAVKMALSALVILVEDREADGVLLDILVDRCGSDNLRSLWSRCMEATPRGVEIDTSGGVTQIPDRIHRAQSDTRLENRPPRLFILCDSDKRWPDDVVQQSHKTIEKIRRICSEQGIPLHVLAKRCAENYIPDSVIEAIRDDPRNRKHAERFDAFLRLTRDQRDHFPIKDGLSEAERKNPFYADRTPADLSILGAGLFPFRGRPLAVLQGERSPAFDREGLYDRDGQGEIDTLLLAIAAEL